jgi:hypothetical protein
MSGGIGEFSVTAGTHRSTSGSDSRPSSQSNRDVGPIPSDAHSHYIIFTRQEWRQATPIRFHNGELEALKQGFRMAAKVPLPEVPGFFPAGSEGELIFQGKDVLHPGSALRNQPLFAHLESLRALVQRCAERKVAFPEFISALNKIAIPASWRNDIVNGLFDTAPNAPALPDPVSASAEAARSQDVDRLMAMLEGPAGTPLGSPVNPSLGRFLEEVGRDSTGFTLRESAARELLKELTLGVEKLREGLLAQPALTEALAFAASLNRLARLAKGRDKQNIHLWSAVPEDPAALLSGDKNGEIRDIVQAIVLIDAWQRDEAFLMRVSALAAQFACPLLVQLRAEEIPPEASPLLEGAGAAHTFFIAGGVAAHTEGDACVFRPGALAFLEGLVASRESAEGFRDKAMVLEDQDVFTEKGQARSSDKLLDNTAAEALRAKGINRVNGVRNRNVAVFPPLTHVEGVR